MVKKRFRCLIWVFLLLPLAGCKTVRDIQLNRITDVQVQEIRPQNIQTTIGVELYNNRSFAGRITNLNCTLSLTDHSIGHAELNDPIDLPAKTNSVIHLSFSANPEHVTQQDFLSIFEPQVAYKLEGSAFAEKPFHLGKVKLDVKSKFDAPETMPVSISPESALQLIAFRGVRMAELGLMESRAILEVSLKNPFSFPITLRGFQYEALTGSSSIADGKLEKEMTLKPGPNYAELPVALHTAGLAGGLLSHKSLSDIALHGTATLREKGRTIELEFTTKQENHRDTEPRS